jgi:hypothetical protein
MAEEVNQKERSGSVHDAINRMLLIKYRAERLGVYGECMVCEGHGYVYTAPTPTLALTLWVLHPRKGASRGVEIASVREDGLPAVRAYLRAAAERNADRFAKI